MKKVFYSLLAVVVAMSDASAGIRVGNLSRNYAGSSKNTAAVEQQYYNANAAAAEDVVVDVELPVRVANKELAEQVKRGDENARTNMETLTKCASIYPDGDFVWDVPTLGRGAGGSATCVAVVEMRTLGSNGTTVARGKLAAGDSVLCNISEFSQETYLPDITKVTFPADQAPTREDVVQVMNEEQKSKAGLKIAAAALVGGLGGNFVGKSAPGEDKMLGTNKEKMKTTAIGAAAGAALMAASTFSGKVAGDVILHTGVNAAAGGVIGNISQSGDDVLRVEKCTDGGVETTCLWGTLTKTEQLDPKGEKGITVFSDVNGTNVFMCERGTDKYTCKKTRDLVVRTVAGEKVGKYPSAGAVPDSQSKQYHFHKEYTELKDLESASTTEEESETVYFIATADKKSSGVPLQAVVVGFKEGAFGTKTEEWITWKATNMKTAKLCLRDTATNNPKCDKMPTKTDDEGNQVPYTLDDFNPKMLSADDGSVIDFSNKARLANTAKGAGVGGAMGAFSGYQGAQADIEDRLTQAIREYNDSLEKVYCGTGKKFLSFYNDDAIIPTMNN